MITEATEGTSVVITGSSDLAEAGLNTLIGRKGIVIEARVGKDVRRNNRGYWVKISGEGFQGTDTWFIPRVSVTIEKPKKAKDANITRGDAAEPNIKITYEEGSGVANVESVR